RSCSGVSSSCWAAGGRGGTCGACSSSCFSAGASVTRPCSTPSGRCPRRGGCWPGSRCCSSSSRLRRSHSESERQVVKGCAGCGGWLKEVGEVLEVGGGTFGAGPTSTNLDNLHRPPAPPAPPYCVTGARAYLYPNQPTGRMPAQPARFNEIGRAHV